MIYPHQSSVDAFHQLAAGRFDPFLEELSRDRDNLYGRYIVPFVPVILLNPAVSIEHRRQCMRQLAGLNVDKTVTVASTVVAALFCESDRELTLSGLHVLRCWGRAAEEQLEALEEMLKREFFHCHAARAIAGSLCAALTRDEKELEHRVWINAFIARHSRSPDIKEWSALEATPESAQALGPKIIGELRKRTNNPRALEILVETELAFAAQDSNRLASIAAYTGHDDEVFIKLVETLAEVAQRCEADTGRELLFDGILAQHNVLPLSMTKAVLEALAKYRGHWSPRCEEDLAKLLSHRDLWVEAAGVLATFSCALNRSGERLLRNLVVHAAVPDDERRNEQGRVNLLTAIGMIGPLMADAVPEILPFLTSDSAKETVAAVLAIGRIGVLNEEVEFSLLTLLDNERDKRVSDIEDATLAVTARLGIDTPALADRLRVIFARDYIPQNAYAALGAMRAHGAAALPADGFAALFRKKDYHLPALITAVRNIKLAPAVRRSMLVQGLNGSEYSDGPLRAAEGLAEMKAWDGQAVPDEVLAILAKPGTNPLRHLDLMQASDANKEDRRKALTWKTLADSVKAATPEIRLDAVRRLNSAYVKGQEYPQTEAVLAMGWIDLQETLTLIDTRKIFDHPHFHGGSSLCWVIRQAEPAFEHILREEAKNVLHAGKSSAHGLTPIAAIKLLEAVRDTSPEALAALRDVRPADAPWVDHLDLDDRSAALKAGHRLHSIAVHNRLGENLRNWC